MNENCWICRRAEEEIIEFGGELFQCKNVVYDDMPVCSYCMAIIASCGTPPDEVIKEMILDVFKENVLKILPQNEG